MYHRQSIELWLYKDLFTINPLEKYTSEVFLLLLASAALVDFPQFRDIHHLIPQVMDIMQMHTAKLDYHQIEDSDKWEIYVNYRQIVSRFLIGQACGIPLIPRNPSSLFSAWSRRGQENYVNLAKYLLKFLSGGL